MKRFVTGAVLLVGFALAGPAMAAPGQCTMTGYDSFECDVTVDGGGITFALPDGQTFVFAHISDGEGLGYLHPAELRPGRYPEELGAFRPLEDEPGCWLGDKDGTKFCAALAE
ncbi:MAG: hypothetical protein ABS75_34095 [Pelagibacterium sp. SCN 63-23]|nr:MAG: hypothetical protein ABS75_34095 [Pelagibacterium sp. SCN 63-23]